ncbi:hypothetical protein ACFSTC_13585 [Nonomuraea ferruginea]
MIRRAGEHGLLVETGALEVSHRLDAALRAERPPEVLEVVPGPETVLVVAPGADQSRLRGLLETLLSHCHDVPSDDQPVRDDTTTTAPRTALDGTTERTTPPQGTTPRLHRRPPHRARGYDRANHGARYG